MPIYGHEPGPRDAAAEEIIQMTNGNHIKMQRQDPFGFIYLSLKNGGLPEKYQGAYTTFAYARQAAQQYLQDRDIAEGECTRPEIKYKHVPAGKEVRKEA